MSSIPLAALAVKQPESPMQMVAQGMQLKSMAGQQQMQQLAMQEQQMDLQDRQKIQKAFMDANGDPDQTVALAAKAGVNPKTVLQLQQMNIKQKMDHAALTKEQLANHQASLQAFGDAAQSVLSMPPELRPQAYAQKRQELIQSGIATGTDVPPQYPGDDQMKLHAVGAMSVKQQLDEEEKHRLDAATLLKTQQETRETTAKAGLAEAQLKATQGGGAAGTGLDVQEANSWLKKNPGKDLADYAKYKATLVPAFNFNLQSAGGPEVPLNDRQKSTAQAVLEGRMSPPGSFALKTPYWQTVMGEVFKQDPQWTEQRAQLRKSYTVGKQAPEINAINTALGHVGNLSDAVDALKNNNIPVLNKIANSYGVQTGQTPVTTFNTIVHRVGPEITKAYVGAGGGEAERGTTQADFDPKLSPDQLKSNIGITAKLLRSKISSLENQWDQNKSETMPSFQDRFIMPAAKQALDKLAPQGGSSDVIYARDLQGKLHTAPAGTKLPAGWKQEQK